MTEFLNILVGGLVTGAVYALLAVGFSLVFNVTGVLNLAQGAFVAMGALVMYDFKVDVHLPLALAFLVSAAVMTVVSSTHSPRRPWCWPCSPWAECYSST